MTDQDRVSHTPCQLDDEFERRLPSRETDPSTACEQAEVRTAVKSAMEVIRSRTSATTYRILHDHSVEGKPYEVIAADLGLSVKQVRDRYYRGAGPPRGDPDELALKNAEKGVNGGTQGQATCSHSVMRKLRDCVP